MRSSCRQEQADRRGWDGLRNLAQRQHEVRLELLSPRTSVPLKINITELMADWLPDSPSLYNIGSSVIHSIYWACGTLTTLAQASPLR